MGETSKSHPSPRGYGGQAEIPTPKPKTRTPQSKTPNPGDEIPLQCGLRLNPCFADNSIFLKDG
jgi:hypothetical protein